jgi:predicted membrane protein (TIGR00267 family)
MALHKRKEFIHHKKNFDTSLIREVVFGMEDGMVSTFGAVVGIAATTSNPFTVILAGSILIGVESLSMAVGSYLSNKSEKEIDQRKIEEEKIELREYPSEEKEELLDMFVADGWPKKLATEMSEVASKNKKLFLKEMTYRELKVFPESKGSPIKNACAMGVSYIIGGAIPLVPYFLFPISTAIPVSIGVTLIGLFLLGVATTHYSNRNWWRAGMEMLVLATAAGGIGYLIGKLVDYLSV